MLVMGLAKVNSPDPPPTEVPVKVAPATVSPPGKGTGGQETVVALAEGASATIAEKVATSAMELDFFMLMENVVKMLLGAFLSTIARPWSLLIPARVVKP